MVWSIYDSDITGIGQTRKHRYDFDLTHLVTMFRSDYHSHLKYCVDHDNLSDFYLRLRLMDKDDQAQAEVRERHRQQEQNNVDFCVAQLTSNVIYFDIQEFMWKTQRQVYQDINKITANASDDVLANTLMPPSSPDRTDLMTYETLIQRQHFVRNSATDKDTILHTAIRENATMMALQIIQIEYNTYLDCVDRDEALKDQLHLTLLETANDKGYTPLFIAAQMGNIQDWSSCQRKNRSKVNIFVASL